MYTHSQLLLHQILNTLTEISIYETTNVEWWNVWNPQTHNTRQPLIPPNGEWKFLSSSFKNTIFELQYIIIESATTATTTHKIQ